VLVVFSGAILLFTKQIVPLYHEIPSIYDLMPSHFPYTLKGSAFALIMVCLLLAIAASWESRPMLKVFSVLASLLMIRLTALVLEINYSSLVLSEDMTSKCSEGLLPILDQSWVSNFECGSKYTQHAVKINELTCPKEEMFMIWESNE
jgi:hypothetical protein